MQGIFISGPDPAVAAAAAAAKVAKNLKKRARQKASKAKKTAGSVLENPDLLEHEAGNVATHLHPAEARNAEERSAEEAAAVASAGDGAVGNPLDSDLETEGSNAGASLTSDIPGP